jgi:hypothetical protein
MFFIRRQYFDHTIHTPLNSRIILNNKLEIVENVAVCIYSTFQYKCQVKQQ